MSLKKVLLQKKIESTLYDIFPKTDATIVQFVKGSGASQTTTDVATELAALATSISSLHSEIIGELSGNESLPELYDTLKEIGDYLDQHDDSIGALAALLTDVGVPSADAVGEPNDDDYQAAVAATGLHATIETLQAAVAALQVADGTNVSKTKSNAADAGNGQVYLDGTLTTIYDDSTLAAAIGTSSDAAAADGTTAWSRLKNAEGDIDTLEGAVGASTDTANSSGTTAWARIKALEAVEATKVEDGTTNGYIKVNGTDDAIQVYDDSDVVNAIGVEPAAAVGEVGDPGYVAPVVGSGLRKRVADLEDRTNVIYAASANAPTAQDAEAGVLYMVELA